MKLNWMRARGISQGAKTFLLLGGIAITGLAIAAGIYERDQRQLEAIENETILTTHLAEMARSYQLLHSLHSANRDDASQCLSIALADTINRVRASAKGVDATGQAFAEGLCARVLRDKRLHPDYYLCGSPKMHSDEDLLWKSVEHEGVAASPAPEK